MKEIKNITVKEFVAGYNKCTTESDKDIYIKNNLVVGKYLPYNMKTVLAENIVKCSSFDNDGNFSPISTSRYLLFVRTIVSNYTNLIQNGEYDNPKYEGTYLEEYDALASSGLVEKIYSLIPEREIGEFKTIVDMTLEDMVVANTSVQTYINKQFKRASDLFKATFAPLAYSLADKLENMSEKDIERFAKAFEKFAVKASKKVVNIKDNVLSKEENTNK